MDSQQILAMDSMKKAFEDPVIREILLKNSLRMLIAGWIYDGNDVLEVPHILGELMRDYEEGIKKLK